MTCGGSIALHVDNHDPVRVVFLTDGSRAVRNDDQSCDEYVALRQGEAREACRALGVTDVEFWPTRDRELAASPNALDRLCRLLESCRPELIHAPSPQEFHPDHRAAADLIWQAVSQTGIEADVAFYESNRPIHINKLVDIGARPLVSVVIRTKNRRHVLREALSSVLAQTYPNIEIVVVNAGVDDISAVVAESKPYSRSAWSVTMTRSVAPAPPPWAQERRRASTSTFLMTMTCSTPIP